MKVKFNKYYLRLGRSEQTILIPNDIETLQWNTIGDEWGNELIGNRKALYALMYTCAVLMFDHKKVIYFPIRGNDPLNEEFWDYRHDVVFTCYQSNLHVSDWKDYKKKMNRMKPETYEFVYDRKRFDKISESEEFDPALRAKRVRTCQGYETDMFDTWFVAMDSKAYSDGYNTLRKLADRHLEKGFIEGGSGLYDIFLTYEICERHHKRYNEEFCYCFMFYDPKLLSKVEAYKEKVNANKKSFLKNEERKLIVNEHDTTKTKREIKKVNTNRKKKKKEVRADDTTDKLRDGTG